MTTGCTGKGVEARTTGCWFSRPHKQTRRGMVAAAAAVPQTLNRPLHGEAGAPRGWRQCSGDGACHPRHQPPPPGKPVPPTRPRRRAGRAAIQRHADASAPLRDPTLCRDPQPGHQSGRRVGSALPPTPAPTPHPRERASRSPGWMWRHRATPALPAMPPGGRHP